MISLTKNEMIKCIKESVLNLKDTYDDDVFGFSIKEILEMTIDLNNQEINEIGEDCRMAYISNDWEDWTIYNDIQNTYNIDNERCKYILKRLTKQSKDMIVKKFFIILKKLKERN